MNWYEHLEQKRKLLIFGTIIICLAALAVTTRWFNTSHDSFWHLQMGLDWLESGQSLWRDHFSFTFNDAEIVSPPFMFQVAIAWVVNQFGLDSGFEIIKLGSFLLTFTLVTLLLRQMRAPTVVYCLVLPLVTALIQLRAIVRPELFSYSLSVVAMMLYYRARNGMSAANMLPILALMLFWGNYHTPIFGYIIFFGYFIDIALRQIHDRVPIRTWLQWLGWGLAIVAVGFLQPGFNHPLIQLLFFSSEWKDLIQEYQSSILYAGTAGMYSLISISLITLTLALRNRQFGLFTVCLLLSYFSASTARLVTPGGIVILCIFAWVVSESDLQKRLLQMPKIRVNVIGAFAMILFVLSMATTVNAARTFMSDNKFAELAFPEDLSRYMKNQGISGRIFNEYGAGGYLIYYLPDSQVYVDGRTGILYPIEHYLRYLDALKSSDILRTEIEKYDINLAVLPNQLRGYALARDTGLLGLDFVGVKFSLFRKENPNFPTLGTLLAYPACWKSDMMPELEEERNKAIMLLPSRSLLMPFAQFVYDYTQSDDKVIFLTEMEKGEQVSRDTMTFAGFQALSLDLNSMAYEFFTTASGRIFSDYLGAALAKARMGEWKDSEQLLDEATRRLVSTNLNEIELLHGLLVNIDQHITLELFDQAYINQLANDLGARVGPDSSFALDLASFCPAPESGSG